MGQIVRQSRGYILAGYPIKSEIKINLLKFEIVSVKFVVQASYSPTIWCECESVL